MINERIALIMLNGSVGNVANDPHHTKEFYHSIQNFAMVSLQYCEKKNFSKLEETTRIVTKLFNEGNEIVKNGIINVYLYTLAHALDKQQALKEKVLRLLPKEIAQENTRQHYSCGV